MQLMIRNNTAAPIYQQIYQQIKEQIINGTLAKELRISIITTKRAYEELERDGFVYTIAGKGVFVARKNTEVLREEWLRQIESHMEAIATLAKGCGLSKADLQEMLNMIYEEDASCNMPSK